MARWEPNASERLVVAALDLFTQRGYENTTVIDIAERAGLTKSTFFRHFQDKREVLFGSDGLTVPLVAGITAADPSATPLEAVAHGLQTIAREIFTPTRRAFAVQRRAVIASHLELQEREALKGIVLTAAMADALTRRGVPDLLARVTAELGALALTITYEQWTKAADTADESTDDTDFADIARRAISEVQTAASQSFRQHTHTRPHPDDTPTSAAAPVHTETGTATDADHH
ncbi:MAG TPA: helix-turn-helix domain-containing protein [Actinocrinis sp.]|nr:helix-turn-helix domain-containing protein [Actinocrinis sp.]